MHLGSALQVSELEPLCPGRDCKFGLALPAHVLWLHKDLLLPTARGLSLCTSVLPFQLWKADIFWSLQTQLHHAAVIPNEHPGGAISATATHLEFSPHIAAPFPMLPAWGPAAPSPYSSHSSLGPACAQIPPTLVPHQPLPPLASSCTLWPKAV